jgi:hypothetical protein
MAALEISQFSSSTFTKMAWPGIDLFYLLPAEGPTLAPGIQRETVMSTIFIGPPIMLQEVTSIPKLAVIMPPVEFAGPVVAVQETGLVVESDSKIAA